MEPRLWVAIAHTTDWLRTCFGGRDRWSCEAAAQTGAATTSRHPIPFELGDWCSEMRVRPRGRSIFRQLPLQRTVWHE